MKTSSLPVVHLITTLDRGGAESQLLVLVKQQVLRNIKVSVLFLKGSGELIPSFEALGVEVTKVASQNIFPMQVLKLRKYLRGLTGSHILHAHLPQAELLATISLSSETRLINSRHFGGKFHPKAQRTISRLLGKFATSKSYKVVAISKSVKEILVHQNEVSKNVQIEVVHYGFDEKEFRNSGSNPLPRPDGELRFGTVARLSPEKDLVTLIRGFKKVRDERSGVSLEIVGAGPLLNALTNLVDELDISEDVSFLGKTSDVAGFMSSLDLFVLTSRFEGFGMVLLEAMSSGCKIVAARNSAIPEVLGDQGAGLFFETGDADSLAAAMKESIGQVDEKFKVAQSERLRLFSAEEMSKKIESVYE